MNMNGKNLEKFAQQNINWSKTTPLNNMKNYWLNNSQEKSISFSEHSIKPKISKDLVRSNSMKTEQLIKEPIDNPLAEMSKTPEGYATEVLVRIIADKINNNGVFDVKYLVFEDNSVGISKDRLADCLSMGRLEKDKEPNSLHEHSAGLKIAIWSFGDLQMLVSKTADSKCAYKILELPCEGQLKIYEDYKTFKENDQGTKIVIKVTNKQKVSLVSRKSDISGRLIPSLGAVYSDALKECQYTKRIFKVNFSLEDIDGNIIDLFDGMWALENKMLLTPLNPRETILDDPLRLLRAFRFSITKGFTISPYIMETLLMDSVVEKLEKVVSQERIRDEVYKMMKHDTLKTLEIFNRVRIINPKILEIIFGKGLWLKPTTEL